MPSQELRVIRPHGNKSVILARSRRRMNFRVLFHMIPRSRPKSLFWLTLCSVLLLLAGVSCSSGPNENNATSTRPNIIFVMTDDHTHYQMSIAGNPLIDTPNLDRLGHEGVWFKNAFCTNSLWRSLACYDPYGDAIQCEWHPGQFGIERPHRTLGSGLADVPSATAAIRLSNGNCGQVAFAPRPARL